MFRSSKVPSSVRKQQEKWEAEFSIVYQNQVLDSCPEMALEVLLCATHSETFCLSLIVDQ